MATILLVSTYELGRQPLGIGGPAAHVLAAGHGVEAVDLAIDGWDDALLESVDAVSVSVPMHTASRLALDVVARVRRVRPDVPVAAHGLYAPLLEGVVDAALFDESPTSVLAWFDPSAPLDPAPRPPARHVLPSLDRYASLDVDGRGTEFRLVAGVETTRGCNHRCRHCPVPVLWDGRSASVGEDAVLADIEAAVALGAGHISFADPDFLNRPPVAQRVVREVHAAFPDLTWDATVKVEHVLRHESLWPQWQRSGCLFIVSAFESVDDDILRLLDKGHTAADIARATLLLRQAGIEVRPSWLPFTPWTTWASLVDLTDCLADLDLLGATDAVQLAIRLLIPPGSLALKLLPSLPFDAEALGHTWVHDDPAIDALAADVAALAEAGASTADVATAIRLAAGAAGRSMPPARPGPRLTESWFCCAEPTSMQRSALDGVTDPVR